MNLSDTRACDPKMATRKQSGLGQRGGKSGRFSRCRTEIMKSPANRAVIWVRVNAKTHATVSVPTLAVCLMLTEREAERERLAVFGVRVCVCMCVCG